MKNIDFLHVISVSIKLRNGAWFVCENWLQRWIVFNLPKHHKPQRPKRSHLGDIMHSILFPISYLLMKFSFLLSVTKIILFFLI